MWKEVKSRYMIKDQTILIKPFSDHQTILMSDVLHTFTCHMCLIPVSAVEKKTVNEDEELKRLCD